METALDDIKELGRETAEANYELTQALANERFAKSRVELCDLLLDRMGLAQAFFKVSDRAARKHAKTLGLQIWDLSRRVFVEMLKSWENLENLPKLKAELRRLKEPETEAFLNHYHKVLRQLVAKSDQEHQSYLEAAYLLKSPANARRLKEAVRDTSEGKVTRWKSVDELIKSKRG
jgi:PHD/YefM family antitoxin component YafN of YafNO toxin-antitoxin module